MADNEPLNDIPQRRLCELIAQYGRELCKDPPHFEALFRNLCGEHRREYFVLVNALKVGIVADIQAAIEGGSRVPLSALAKRMHLDLSLPEALSNWAVESWAKALGGARQEAKAPAADAKPAAEKAPAVPAPSAEHRRIAMAQFERANQVINNGNYDYGIQLLLTCCKLDPANLIYRQALRRIEKVKFKDHMQGSKLALLTLGPIRAKLKSAKRSREFLKALEYGEELLAKDPWDTAAQLDMAEAANGAGLGDLAIWILIQARQKDPNDATVNRTLAELYEKRGNFTQAISLWELVAKANPTDIEARHKAKDLAASHTIRRGQYDDVPGRVDRLKVGTSAAPPSKPLNPEEARRAAVTARVDREMITLRKRLETDPTNPSLYIQMAAVYRRASDFEKATDALREGLAATGNDFQLIIELAELEVEPFRNDLNLTEDKLRADPENEELRKIRINLLKEVNSRELEIYRRKADRYPTEMSYRLEMGMRLLRGGQVDEAIRELQQARTDPRFQWRALLYLGHCFKARNNWRLAQRNFEEALKLLPPNGEDNTRKEILFNLATGTAAAGDLAAAIELGHELANLDFTYRNIGNLLDEWQAGLQQQA
jgi:tetratricopeptide (TPR) repeat protein